MKVQVDETLTLEVYFNLADRAIGYEDDIRFALQQFGSPTTWLFPANEISFFLTVPQAEQLATALLQAAAASKNDPSPGVRLPEESP
jgi:hypothetical protein